MPFAINVFASSIACDESGKSGDRKQLLTSTISRKRFMTPHFDSANSRYVQSSVPNDVSSQPQQFAIKSEISVPRQGNNPPLLRPATEHTAARAEWEMRDAQFSSAACWPGHTMAAMTGFQTSEPDLVSRPAALPPVTGSATVALPPGTVADFTMYQQLRQAVSRHDLYRVTAVIKHPECQQALIQMQPGGGMSPLMMASLANKTELVLALLNTSCVNVQVVDSQLLLTDQHGKTALHYAEENGHPDVLAVLRPMHSYALQRQQVAGHWPVQWDQHPYMTPGHYAEFLQTYVYIYQSGSARYASNQ